MQCLVTCVLFAISRAICFSSLVEGEPLGTLTTGAGAPVEVKDATSSIKSNLIRNEYLMDSLTHIVRERIPERIVHAKAGGAFGYFEVTHDISHVCKANFLKTVGKKTPVAARFSPAIIERGGTDTTRDARGFAVKFYTEDGNFDIVGFNTPMYVYKDPHLFTGFVRSQMRNPASNMIDANTMWDYMTLRPESLHMMLLVFSDRGVPDGYRHMPGFGIHTFQLANALGEPRFVRFHFEPEAGVKNLWPDDARRIGAVDPDYAIRDLYHAIDKRHFPIWSLKVQILTMGDIKKAKFDPFDVTKVLPLKDYPLHPVGKLVLNKNPINYFAEIEQLAFNPANLVPGILGGPDKVFEARRFAYRDAQYYRLGANFQKILVNCPLQTQALTYNRDGVPPVKDNERDHPNYYPNTFNGSAPYVETNKSRILQVVQDDSLNFEQAAAMYMDEMSRPERARLAGNLAASLRRVVGALQRRALALLSTIHPDLGNRVALRLKSKAHLSRGCSNVTRLRCKP